MADKSIKEIVMEKKQNSVTPPVYPSTSFSIVKSAKTGLWTVVEIPFNYETGEVGKISVVSEDVDRPVAIERFKVTIGRSSIMRN
jgi:hypothetical protein